MIFARRRIAGMFAIALLQGVVVLACKVPVFRYALERWPADRYRMVALVEGGVEGEVAEAIELLRGFETGGINTEVEIIDLAQLSEAELWQVEGLEDTSELPQLQVLYPERDGRRKFCWRGELNSGNVRSWRDSPLRDAITTDIQAGVSAVWVLVEGDDVKENDRLHRQLEAALESATAELEIAEGVIERSDAARYLSEHPSASMDDVLRSDLPLEIRFSVHRLSSGSTDEMAMLAMIQNWGDAGHSDAPFVFPVFGRGRMIEPLPKDVFSTESVETACRYLVGECSCSVKALNPGIDLMLSTHWQSALGEQIILVDTAARFDAESTLVPIPPGRENLDPEEVSASVVNHSASAVPDSGLSAAGKSEQSGGATWGVLGMIAAMLIVVLVAGARRCIT